MHPTKPLARRRWRDAACAKLGIARVAVAAAVAATGCGIEIEPIQKELYQPVARSAEQAWPQAPPYIGELSAEQIATACALTAVCRSEAEAPLLVAGMCNIDVVFSAERAIPMTGLLGRFNERAEFFVDCVLAARGHCASVNACLTPRHHDITCEEAGCRWLGAMDPVVTCNGNKAAIDAENQRVWRDCSRSFTQCDESNPTGCTDRPLSYCPPELEPIDRCDGNVRLGCDAFEHVSYHDCERLGGTCAIDSDGWGQCVYPDLPEPNCHGASYQPAQCQDGVLWVCINGQRVQLAHSPLCSAAIDR